MRSWFIEHVAFPAAARLTPFDVSGQLRAMCAADFQPLPDQAAARLAALQQLVADAADVPLVAEALATAGLSAGGIRGLDDVRRLPITTKQDLRDGFPDRHIDPRFRRAPMRWSNTSGSTGRPLLLVQDLDDISWKYASILRSRRLSDTDPFGSQLRFTPNECQPCSPEDRAAFAGWGSRSQRVFEQLEQRVLNPLFHRRTRLDLRGAPWIGPDSFPAAATLDRIEAERPEILLLYPIFAMLLVKHLRATGRRPPPIGSVLDFSGGLCTPRMRARIAETFQTPTSQACGGCEFARYGASCTADPDHMHLAEGFCYVEALRADGSPCADGELGNLIVTSLHSRAMPLLRLEPGDVGRIYEAPCACGRSSRRLRHEGRVQAVFRNADDQWVTAWQVWDRLFCIDGVALFQLHQLSQRRYRLDLVPQPGQALDQPALDDALRDLLGAAAKVELREESAIPAEPSGKLQLVKSATFEDFRVQSARRHVVPTN